MTASFAATAALVQNDLKRVIAQISELLYDLPAVRDELTTDHFVHICGPI